MQIPEGLHQTVIDKAFESGDKETVIEAYLDVLNYKSQLSDGAFVKVLESSSLVEVVDHVLFGHVKEQMDQRKLDSRLQMSVYYFNINGGLTASDLLNDLAADKNVQKVMNSELFKNELVAKIAPTNTKLDGFVREKITEALRALKPKLDIDFYGLQDLTS